MNYIFIPYIKKIFNTFLDVFIDMLYYMIKCSFVYVSQIASFECKKSPISALGFVCKCEIDIYKKKKITNIG